MLNVDGKIPMRWWDNEKNFGDLLGPWLVEKMTGRETVWVERDQPHYLVIGSILDRVSPSSVLWGIGSFGNEGRSKVVPGVKPLAVRGPLTRARFQMFGVKAPRVYGDPALLIPDYYSPRIEKTHELGVVLRWSENKRKAGFAAEGVKVIDLLTTDVEGTLGAILSCKRILSTSLHGLVLADAYGIPNAWLIADTGAGKEHKFWDYLISVGKERAPAEYDLTAPGLTLANLLDDFHYDDRSIHIDLDALRATCPFLARSEEIELAEATAVEGSERMVLATLQKQQHQERRKAARAERRRWWKAKNWPQYPGMVARHLARKVLT